MRNVIFIGLIILGFPLFSQNTIILKTNKSIKAEKIALDKSKVYLKENNNFNNPPNEIDKSLIKSIIMANGKELNQENINSYVSTNEELIEIKSIIVSNIEIKSNFSNNYTLPIGLPIKLKSIKKFDVFELGETVELIGLNVFIESENKSNYNLIIKKSSGQTNNFKTEILNSFKVESKLNPEQIWQLKLIKSKVYTNMSSRGFQYDIRNSLNDDNIEYLKKLQESNQIFIDDYFEDYLYSLSNKIHKGVLFDGRQGNLVFKIIKNPTPNAFCLSNGTIILTTGLISTLESERELVAILAHEIAHFVLDHSIANLNVQIDRKKRAEFWAAFATVAAGAADIYLGTKNPFHQTGILTYNVALASAILANDVLVQLGLKYNREQENEADEVAKEIIESLGYPGNSLGIALTRIKQNLLVTGNYNIFSNEGTHPDINERIGEPISKDVIKASFDKNYLKHSSYINSLNASIELEAYAHHVNAEYISSRNINNGFGLELDYLVKAKVTRRLNNSDDSNKEALNLLIKAKNLNVNGSLLLNKELGLTYNRLNNSIEANKYFELYFNDLIQVEKLNGLQLQDSEYLKEEKKWVRQMIFKNRDH